RAGQEVRAGGRAHPARPPDPDRRRPGRRLSALRRCHAVAMTVGDGVLAFATAFLVALAVTPLVGRVATRIGMVDQPRDRGLSDRPTPQLGGVALLAGVLVAAALWLHVTGEVRGIVGGAAIIVAVGAIDDAVDLPAPWKLAGQALAALVPVLAGVEVHNFTLPFVHRVDLGSAAAPRTLARSTRCTNGSVRSE